LDNANIGNYDRISLDSSKRISSMLMSKCVNKERGIFVLERADSNSSDS